MQREIPAAIIASDIERERVAIEEALSLRRSALHPLCTELQVTCKAALQAALAAGDFAAATQHAASGVAFARAAYAHVPNHPHVALQRYTLGQLLCEVAQSKQELRLGCAELSAAAASLRVCGGSEGDMAKGATELLEHHQTRLATTTRSALDRYLQQ